MEHSIGVAVGQFAPGTDTVANLESVRALADEAAASGARVLAVPEYSMFTGPKLDRTVIESAQPLDGPFVTGLLEIAQRNNLVVVAGINELLADDPRISNTLVAAAPDGTIAAEYRKLHLYDAFGFTESDVVRPGDIEAPQTFTVDGVTFGLQTCYDLRFPEVTRRLVDADAHVVLLPAQWVPGPLKEEHWTTLVRARAIENTVYVAAAGQTAPSGAANSMIVDPMGVVVAAAGERVGTAGAQVSVARIDAVRAKNPALKLRRFL
ncbi:carbon-nitrogen hydrolase family protein [Antrihabitans cavernicola]|uniref:Carbon-nitrogen hydrolase family protein n=1 Tax=Antrihabitans cavernicola TaxID=2495913 RepID=A0A5A7SB35_9NOCA|nr:carbon-nitrogen hydrolase family protein [Spelaeibacter cavernicola]KAA0022509.1 carbon-nitrogen hydrolase family protein [Spelaeibacter cavernicola]